MGGNERRRVFDVGRGPERAKQKLTGAGLMYVEDTSHVC